MQEKQRTTKQNRALHKFFSELADELNENGAEGKLKSMGVGRFETFFYELESKEIE